MALNDPDTLFAKYADAIRSLPSGELPKTLLKSDTFLLERAGNLAVYYAPFDYVNLQAKVILVGITPGWTQMQLALQEARRPTLDGLGRAEVCRIVKQKASFAGRMRTNLIGMLDQLGLREALQIRSSADLFQSHRDLLHTTSLLRYPVFVGERDYDGSRPLLLQPGRRNELVNGWSPLPLRPPVFNEFLAPLKRDLRQIPKALIISFGEIVSPVITALVRLGDIPAERVLFGFPHPSGGNGHRHAKFEAEKDQMREHVHRFFGRP
jgi:hypothetical protein